jgi:hypothetical protein
MELIGYCYPPKDGNIMLAIATDDPGELYLSTDDNPANKALIATETQWNGIRSFNGNFDTSVDPPTALRRSIITCGDAPVPRPENWSAFITVTAGKPYFIQAIGTEYGGGDNTAVAFRYEGDADFANGDKPISGQYLSPFAVSAKSGIATEPQDAAAYVGSTATFSIGLDIPPGATLTSIKWTKNGTDVAIIDTAGRLQTQQNLMKELTKIHRVLGNRVPGAPHEVLLVLDSTAGQNAISQARGFTEAVQCSGIILAKIDGTAKGGVVIPIRQQFGLPVKYVGVGEKAEDLALFKPETFVEALFTGLTEETAAA